MMSTDILEPTVATFPEAVVMPVVEFGDHERLFLNSPYYRHLGGVYSQGRAVPEALHVRAREIIEPADRPGNDARPGEFQAPEMPPRASCAGYHIYCGRAFPHLAHFVCEGLARIWYAREHPDATLVWTGATGYTSLQLEILALLGLRNPALFVQEPTLVESLAVPSQGHIMPTFHAPYFLDSIAVMEPARIVPGKKTYVSRVNSQGGRYINESALEAMLRDAGWDILHPELLPFSDRFDALSSSEVILTIEGAAITSLLFFRELHSRLFTLTRNASEITGYDIAFRDYFGAMARDKGWHYRRLDLPKRWVGGQRTGAQFELDLDAFADLMRSTGFLSRNSHATDALNKPYPRRKDYDITIASAALDAVSARVDDVMAHVYRAGVQEADGLCDRAKDELRAAVRRKPDSVYLHLRLAELLRRSSDLEGARDAFHRAVAVSRDDSYEPHVWLAELHRDLGDPHGAIAEARQAVVLMPGAPTLRSFLADLLLRTDALNEARRELGRALELDPRLATAHILLSRVFFACGNIEQAIKSARTAIEYAEEHPDYRVHLAHLLTQQGDLGAASAALGDALAMQPSHEGARLALNSLQQQMQGGSALSPARALKMRVRALLRSARMQVRRFLAHAPWRES